MKKKYAFILLSLVLTSCGNLNNSENTSSSSSSSPSSFVRMSFYLKHEYHLTDLDSTKENILIVIYSNYCSHCIESEEKLNKVYDTYFSSVELVTVSTNYIRNEEYKLPLKYQEAVKFYYEQGSDYVDPGFLPDSLYSYENYPTPTMMYLKENREMNHIIFGLDSTEEGIKASIESLIN